METHKKALSIRQPWAWLIVNGFKDIENRSWQTNLREEIFIHASKTMTGIDYRSAMCFVEDLKRNQNVALPIITIPDKKDLQYGGIVGAATITACVTESDSPWFTGDYGFVLEDPRVLSFMPCPGTLKFFYPSY
jgi:hypothetical protein